MALRCLAILGSKNEPLYICASGDGDDQQTSSNTEADVFGFFGNGDDDNVSKKEASGFIGKPPSIRHEMMVHSAIDRIEESLGSYRGKMNWKKFQRGSHWMGQICPMEEYDIYGYVTTSDVKILALLDREEIIPAKKRKEVDIKIMFTEIHDCYVRYTLNPFSKMRAKIQPPCAKFETNLQSAMDQYNNAVKGN